MPGTIIKRGTGRKRRWFVVMDHGRDESGRRIRKWKSFAKKREAESHQIQSASHPAFGAGQGPYGSAQLRLGAFLQQWLADHAKVRVRPSTFRRYGEFVNLHVSPGLGHVQLTRLSPQVIEGFYRDLQKKLSSTTARHIAVLLRQSLDTAVRWGLILQNPADKVERPKPSRWVPTLLNAEQAVKLLDGARGRKHYLLYTLLLTTGLRLGEALALTWADIDFVHGVLFVRQGKTPNARRGLRLPDELVKDLRAARGVGLIFRTKTGGPLDPGTIRNDYFYPLLEKLKLPKIRLHDPRHMHGSFLLQDGVDLATVSARLGHASKAFTMQQYIHALATGQERAAESSNQFLTKARTFSALAAEEEPSQHPHK